jgi:Protein of unknown function (DUF3575).
MRSFKIAFLTCLLLLVPLGVSAQRPWEVKTNLLSLPALVLNAGVEYQPVQHLSVNMPVYFGTLDWFSREAKFRTLALQPEIRYWFRPQMKGIFVGAHATVLWYNVAVGGDYRYQDHGGKTPSVGAGVDVGYKIRLGKAEDSPWGLEFGLGVGLVPLRYDVYYNVDNGRLAAEDRQKTYWGPDQAFVTLTYGFGTSKTGKR